MQLFQSRIDRSEASCVIHIRNVPGDVNEHEIALLAIPFGSIQNMVVSKKNNQALIEMQSIDDSMQLVDYYSKYPVQLHGKNVILQFSTHQRLELISENSAIVGAIKNANQIVEQDLSGAHAGVPNTVIRIIVENIMGQQINHIILHKVRW